MLAVSRNTFVLVALDTVGASYLSRTQRLSVRYTQWQQRGHRVRFVRTAEVPLGRDCRVLTPTYPADSRNHLRPRSRG